MWQGLQSLRLTRGPRYHIKAIRLTLSRAERYQRYKSVVDGFGNMKVEQCYVDKSLKDIEKKLTENRYHVNHNRNGENKPFSGNTIQRPGRSSLQKRGPCTQHVRVKRVCIVVYYMYYTSPRIPPPPPRKKCLEPSINKLSWTCKLHYRDILRTICWNINLR